MLKKYLTIFVISMMPIVELRGAIPIGVAMDVPFWACYLICVIGNILPVPFLILFSKRILEWLSKFEKIGPFFRKIINKADEKAKSLGKVELFGLFTFVAIPLPGTGAWTGSLVAAVLRMRIVPAFISITLGVLTSGLIMGFVSFGLFDVITRIFA